MQLFSGGQNITFGLNQSSCETIFQQLSSQFKMENLGSPTTFLGLNIIRKANTISINQTGYIHRMLKRFNMQNAVPAKTPLPHSLPLLKATPLDRRCNQLEYTVPAKTPLPHSLPVVKATPLDRRC